MAADEAGSASPFGMPIGDQGFFSHAELDQLEERFNSSNDVFRWDGAAWVGSDLNRFLLRSEGYSSAGQVYDGQDEALYDHPLSTYFDFQAGVRYDLESLAGRGWGAVGIAGLAPYGVKVAATAYASDGGHYALKLTAAYELFLTQRLVLEPQVEINGYTRADWHMQVASGWSQAEAGARLRYEISRKFAPYLGVSYARSEPLSATTPAPWSLDAGVRLWL